MNIGRRMLLVLLTPLFTLFLFAAAFDAGILRVAGSPAPVKKILADSGVYQNIVPNLLSQAKNISNGSTSISLTDPEVQAAAKKAISPQFVEQSANNAIDGIYNWLDGKTPTPDFKIDLSSQKASLAKAIGSIAGQRAASLPDCTSLAAISAASTNYLGATCIPPGVTPQAVASQAQASALSGKGFLDNANITPNDIKSSGSNQSVFSDQLKSVPKQYQRIKKTPLILAALALLSGAAMVFINPSRRKGLRHVGITLVVVGALMMVFSWSLNYAVNQKLLPKMNFNNPALQSDIKSVATDIVQSIDKNYWTFGGIYAALGAVAIASSIWLLKGQEPVRAKADAESGEPPAEPPAKKPAKIQ